MLQILPTPSSSSSGGNKALPLSPLLSLPCVLIYMLPPPSNPLLFHGGMTSYGSPLFPPLAARAKHPTPPPLYSHVYGIQGTGPIANGIPRREPRLAGASSATWLVRGKKVKYLITPAGCCGFRANKEDCGTKPKLTAIHGFDLRPSPRARTLASPFFF